jgi:hypothetical protein
VRPALIDGTGIDWLLHSGFDWLKDLLSAMMIGGIIIPWSGQASYSSGSRRQVPSLPLRGRVIHTRNLDPMTP